MEKTNVVIADDQKLFSSSIKMVLEKLSRGSFNVLATAENGIELLEIIGKHQPDLALVDIRMPGMDGMEAAKIIHQRFPGTKILMLTTFDFDEYIEQSLEIGVMGYVLKDCQPEELINACRTILEGKPFFSKEVMVRMPAGGKERGYKSGDILEERLQTLFHLIPDLVRREAEVLDLMMKLYDNFEIGEKLEVSEQTVKNYASSIYAKLGVKDRMHAIRFVRKKLENWEAGIR